MTRPTTVRWPGISRLGPHGEAATPADLLRVEAPDAEDRVRPRTATS